MTKVRNDKTWEQATSLDYLNELFNKSKPTKRSNNNDEDNDDDDDADEENLVRCISTEKRRKISIENA
jgi:hypothetical protein